MGESFGVCVFVENSMDIFSYFNYLCNLIERRKYIRYSKDVFVFGWGSNSEYIKWGCLFRI